MASPRDPSGREQGDTEEKSERDFDVPSEPSSVVELVDLKESAPGSSNRGRFASLCGTQYPLPGSVSTDL